MIHKGMYMYLNLNEAIYIIQFVEIWKKKSLRK